MNCNVISVINQKGGVGKSTTADALRSGLTLKGYSCLTIDLDAQVNLTFTAGADTNGNTILGVLSGDIAAKDAIQKTPYGDFIASSKSLAGADAFITETGKEYKLSEAIDSLKNEYDFIVIDTPPALGILTINALTASQEIIIPAQADIYSLLGIEQLAETLKPVRKYCNPGIKISGILLTRYNPRSILSRDVTKLAEQTAEKLDTRVFVSKIREAVAIKEAQISKKSLFEYAPNSNVAKDYSEFVEELLTSA